MRFLIVGAGAVGGYVGGRLAADGNEVMFMERDAVSSVLATRGIRIESSENPFLIQRPEVYSDPESAGFFDFVLICVRVAETESIIEPVRSLLSFDCAVISLQSGVDATYRLRQAFGEHVLPGYTRIAVECRAPGIIRELHPAPAVAVSEFDGRGSWRLECAQIAFESAGFSLIKSDPALHSQWKNFLLEAALASTAALTGFGIRRLLQQAEEPSRIHDLLAEGLAIASAEDVALDDTPEALLSSVDSDAEDIWLHMQRDLKAGRLIENEALAGSLHRRAQAVKIDAPGWTRLYEALRNRAPSLSPGREPAIPPVSQR